MFISLVAHVPFMAIAQYDTVATLWTTRIILHSVSLTAGSARLAAIPFFNESGFRTFEVDILQLILGFYLPYSTTMLEISLGAEIKRHIWETCSSSKFYTSSEPTGSDNRQFPHKVMSLSRILPVFIGLLRDVVSMSNYTMHCSIIFFIGDWACAVLPLIILRCIVFAYSHAVLSTVLIWNLKRTGNANIPISNFYNWNRTYLQHDSLWARPHDEAFTRYRARWFGVGNQVRANHICPSVCLPQGTARPSLDFYRKMTYMGFLQKFLEAFQLWLKSDKNNIQEDLSNCTFISLREWSL